MKNKIILSFMGFVIFGLNSLSFGNHKLEEIFRIKNINSKEIDTSVLNDIKKLLEQKDPIIVNKFIKSENSMFTGTINLLLFLLLNGSNPNAQNDDGKTVLCYNLEYLKYLSEKNKNQSYKKLIDNYINIINLLLENGAIFDQESKLIYNSLPLELKNKIEYKTNSPFESETGKKALKKTQFFDVKIYTKE